MGRLVAAGNKSSMSEAIDKIAELEALHIVNGPGEMADADYGYVGKGVGTIAL